MPSTLEKSLLPYKVVQLGVNDNGFGREVVKRTNAMYRGYKAVEMDVTRLKKGEPIGDSNVYRRNAWIEEARKLEPNLYPLSAVLAEAALVDGTLPNANHTKEDLGIFIWRSEGKYAKLAGHLIKQSADSIHGGKASKDDIFYTQAAGPIVIYDLKTVKDGSFPHGLRLDL